jgi:pimeloyl-ACP methyl ester carboxylesterase
MSKSASDSLPYTEHRVPNGPGRLFVRDFPGDGPAFVMLHGFPDNSHIYDDLIPHLSSAGRRIVAFDFMGFGDSDKLDRAAYGFEQQLADLQAVVDALKLEEIVPVGHDAGGPAAVNFAIRYPERTAGVCLMNAFYDQAPGLRVPEFIELFATKNLRALTQHFLQSPQQFAWLLAFQRGLMQIGLSDSQRAHYDDFLGPIIGRNFAECGAGPAFGQMTFQLFDELVANSGRLQELWSLDLPFQLIWGETDAYLHLGIADDLRSKLKRASLHVLPAGHWPQIDEPARAASILLGAS